MAFANRVVEGARRAQAVLARDDTDVSPLVALADRIERLDETQRGHALALIASLDAFLDSTQP